VALKVLPFAATLDARQLQRFKNEAHTAAGLHHSHIVPVYAVGCERGVHYYAMQFIAGQTLASLIATLRRDAERPQSEPAAGPARPKDVGGVELPVTEPCPPPSGTRGPGAETPSPGLGLLSTAGSVRSRTFFEATARLGIEAAEALDYAHGLGVIHRDIKPANLMLDGRGELWVTDFGLAQAQTDGRLTLTGDLVGTLRYMSPEQALARPGGVDGRSDVYSLGATLYELLTLEPPFAGSDRQELLRQIAFDEPRPPCRLNTAVPAELETVVLKALAKAPEDRYQTAQELADDLRLWLEDRPIRARRPTLWQRTRKWTRRHRPAVLTAVGCAVVLLLAGVGWLVWEVRQEKARVAQISAAKERVSEALGETQRARDEEGKQRRLAEDITTLSLDALNQVYLRLGATQLQRDPWREDAARGYLRKLLGYYRRLARQQSRNARVRQEIDIALVHVGGIYQRLGQQKEARDAFARAIPRLTRLLREFPGERRLGEALFLCHHRTAVLLYDEGALPEAEKCARRALAVIEPLSRSFAEPRALRRYLAGCHNSLGAILNKADRPRQAERAHGRARALLERLAAEAAQEAGLLNELGDTLHHIAHLRYRAGDRAGAVELLQQAIRRQEAGLRADRSYSPCFEALAKHHQSLSLVQEGAGDSARAEEAARQALRMLEMLAAVFPSVPRFRRQQLVQGGALGMLLLKSGKHKAGLDALRQALAIGPVLVELDERLLAKWPAERAYRVALADDLGRFGALGLFLPNGARDAEARCRRAAAAWAELVRDFPTSAEYREGLAGAAFNRGLALQALARRYGDQALALLRQGADRGLVTAADLRQARFEPLRSRADFQELQEALAAKEKK
jgi:tetratricopeptide (TPR) repeat protein